MRGLFITIEGGEGVGKSTNLTFLETFLRNSGVDLVSTREPGGTALGEDIRAMLLRDWDKPMCPNAELLLIFAARAQHLNEVIEPALAAGKWVLCDRFTDATYAYQCAGRGMDREKVKYLESFIQGHLRPDYTVLLDVPVQIGIKRARERGELDRFEQEEVDFFERVREGYLIQAENNCDRYRLINANRSLAEVQQDLLRFGSELLATTESSQTES
ncbi:MAG: dTMP kinase [Halioglobus sp.]